MTRWFRHHDFHRFAIGFGVIDLPTQRWSSQFDPQRLHRERKGGSSGLRCKSGSGVFYGQGQWKRVIFGCTGRGNKPSRNIWMYEVSAQTPPFSMISCAASRGKKQSGRDGSVSIASCRHPAAIISVLIEPKVWTNASSRLGGYMRCGKGVNAYFWNYAWLSVRFRHTRFRRDQAP